ncbi:uncharacterized protein V6R79_021649 [Siganus canaliculatus]
MDFPGHFQHIFKQLNQQRLHAQLCDCVVVVGGQSFQAHRSILAACSSHFKALLSSTESEDGVGAGGPSVMELDAGVVTPEAFSTLLDMIYTSTLCLGTSNVMDVLLAASHLHLNTVVKACKLHLSRKNFPASAPKAWRSVQQHQQCLDGGMPVTSVMSDAGDEEEVAVVVSQSGGTEGQEVRRTSSNKQIAPPLLGHKRKSHEDRPRDGKRPCRSTLECSPTVTRSNVSTDEGGEELLSPDCMKTADGPWEGQGEDEEVEEKYDAPRGETEEIQLPSQSDSSIRSVCAWEKGGATDGGTVVKVKVGDEGEDDGEQPKMEVVEVKKENLSSYSPDSEPMLNNCPQTLSQNYTDNLDTKVNDDKILTACPTEGDVSSLQPQLCSELQNDADEETGDLGDESVDAGEGILSCDSLSELAFSCFLNQSSESVMGSLEEEDSLASLTAAATAAAAASDATVDDAPAASGEELGQNPEAQSSTSSSSLVFPVSSVPLQQLIPTQASGFSNTLILQPTQNSLTGILSGIRSGLSLETSFVQPSKTTKNSGATTFRRIAPKVPPSSETGADGSSTSADAAERPPLTRASEDVLSKCKKAAAEDHVLLVEGEKKYACKICCKTFMNLTDCKKHIRVHTGEKPYPCPKCGKRFSQSSHLYKHSKNTCLNWKDEQSLPDMLLSPAHQ